MNVNVTYRLSQAGQRAAVISGRIASSIVSEVMSTDDASLLEKFHISSDGTISYNRGMFGHPDLDAPPADLPDLIASIDAANAAKAKERQEREAAENEQKRRNEKRSHPIVERLIAELNAIPLDHPLPSGIDTLGPDSLYRFFDASAVGTSNYSLIHTPEQKSRCEVRLKERAHYQADQKAAEEAAKVAARDAMIAEHGGIVFPVEAGMCKFSGAGLWLDGQSKRWVGVFTSPKGIDSFCESPRGEHVFSVSSLHRGDCIQGAGYDTNSRGKRRKETEWFGVVVRVGVEEIVIDLQESRATTMKAAAKLDHTERQRIDKMEKQRHVRQNTQVGQ